MQTVKLGTLYQNGKAINYDNSPVSFISSASLELKVSSGNASETIEWVSFSDGAKKFLISTKNILNNISFNDINIRGLVSGSTLVTLDDGLKYKIKILTNNEWDKYICNSIGISELLTPTSQDTTSGSYNDSTIATSISNNIWHWWKMSSITQTVIGDNIIVRGNEDTINGSISISKSTIGSNYGLRLICQLYNEPPKISGKDTSLGSLSTYLTQTYSITDSENDFFKVEEILDNTIPIRTLENQTSGTNYILSLQDMWNSISEGTHTITIKVTDVIDNISIRTFIFNKVNLSSGTSLTLTRPAINVENNTTTLYPIDANIDNKITFTAKGGGLVYSNEISVIDNSSLVEVYKYKDTENFDFDTIIPKNTLTNGKIYQIKIRTYDSNGLYSEWSDLVLVRCLTPATLVVTNIVDGKITSQNPLFTATYSQKEGEILYSYDYTLLKDGVIIEDSKEITDGLLQYQFSNYLDNKATYDIRLSIKTQNNLITTITQEFYTLYEQNKLPAVIKLKNDPDNGCIIVNSYIRQILGRIESGDNIYYIDGTWANLHNTIVVFDGQGSFKTDGEWTMKAWSRDLEDKNVMLVKLNNDLGYIELTRYGQEFWIKKYYSDGTLLYEKYDSVSGDINAEDQFFFFVQHIKATGLMNFEVKRITDGTTTWYKPQTANDLPPSVTHTTYNAYDKEDGFLTNFSDGLRSLIIPVSIDGVNTNVYLPSKENLIGDNAYPLFKNIQPIEDINYAEERNVLGEYVIGESLLASETDTDNSNISVRVQNNYTGSNPLVIKYKIFNYANLGVTIYEKVDDITFNIRKNIVEPTIADEFTIDLTSVWNDISFGVHTLKIMLVDSVGYSYTKELTFGKALNKTGILTQSAIDLNTNTTLTLTKGQAYKYYTRTVDTTNNEKIVTIDSLGVESSEYPKAMDVGERVIFNLPVGARCTTYKDSSDGCYIVTTKLNNIFTTQTLGDLKVGDKIKECFTIYSDENIEFTIVDKNETMVTVMTNIITIKPFDVAESVLLNGDILWNQSNVKQWLNSNNKLVRRK